MGFLFCSDGRVFWEVEKLLKKKPPRYDLIMPFIGNILEPKIRAFWEFLQSIVMVISC